MAMMKELAHFSTHDFQEHFQWQSQKHVISIFM